MPPSGVSWLAATCLLAMAAWCRAWPEWPEPVSPSNKLECGSSFASGLLRSPRWGRRRCGCGASAGYSPRLDFLRAARLALHAESGSTSCSGRGVPPADEASSTPRSRRWRATHATTSTGFGSQQACACDSAAILHLLVLLYGGATAGSRTAAELEIRNSPGLHVLFSFSSGCFLQKGDSCPVSGCF